MNPQFDPGLLRIIGRLAWMSAGDDSSWFSVPDSNEQLVFNEDGVFATALTGIELEIVFIDETWIPEIRSWPVWNTPRFAELCECGKSIYGLLADAGVRLWSRDETDITEWVASNVIYYNADGSIHAMSRLRLKQLLKSREAAGRINRQFAERNRVAHKAKVDDSVMRQLAERDEWRESQEYQSVFRMIVGGAEDADPSCAPRLIQNYAHKICEYRLGLAEFSSKPGWAPLPRGANIQWLRRRRWSC